MDQQAQPAGQLRGILTELETLGWGSLWSWEVFGREALTNAGLLLSTSQQLVVGTGIANIWARSILGTGPLLAVEQAVVEQDPATARRLARELLAFYLTLPNYVRAWERAGFEPEDLADGGSDRLVDAVVAWGSPDAIAERVTAHLEAGADHVCLHVLDPTPAPSPWRVVEPSRRCCWSAEPVAEPVTSSGAVLRSEPTTSP